MNAKVTNGGVQNSGWQKEINISGMQNAERYVNQILAYANYLKQNLLSVGCVGNTITFSFTESRQKPHIRTLAKQFSKKKYASCDEGVEKFVETARRGYFHNWEEVLRVEQKRYWLVIFIER